MPSRIPSPIEPSEVREVLASERPELLEAWEASDRVAGELTRLALNATWTLQRAEGSSSSWVSTRRATGELRRWAIDQAVWLATPDDLDEHNTFDRDPDSDPLDETQLRSGWFST